MSFKIALDGPSVLSALIVIAFVTPTAIWLDRLLSRARLTTARAEDQRDALATAVKFLAYKTAPIPTDLTNRLDEQYLPPLGALENRLGMHLIPNPARRATPTQPQHASRGQS